MERIPPEMWEMVFGNLRDSRDFWNATQASKIWRDYLADSKSAWMFGHVDVFPFILKHLSKSDILQCRLVCRHWCYGVDHFLENNSHHRPATEEIWNTGNLKTNYPRDSVKKLLESKKLLYHSGKWPSKIIKDLTHFPARCPVVGRSLLLTQPRGHTIINKEYLNTLGNHISFLELNRDGVPPFHTLQHIIRLLMFFPNLKTLGLTCHLPSPRAVRQNPEEFYTQILEMELNAGIRERLPKLEAFKILIVSPFHTNLQENLFKVLRTEKMESLDIVHATSSLPNVNLKKLVDLSIQFNSDEGLSQLYHCDSPIRRLSLVLRNDFRAPTLFAAIQHFRSTLSNLDLTLDLQTVKAEEYISNELLRWQLNCFSDSQILLNMPKLKRVTLKKSIPVSLNFLCGLRRSLEYLHISFNRLGRWDFQEIGASMPGLMEELDLLEYLKTIPHAGKLIVYKSSVWKMFPKLRVLTLNLVTGEQEYRRDVYDKITSCYPK